MTLLSDLDWSSLKTSFVVDLFFSFFFLSPELFFSQSGSLIWLKVQHHKCVPADCAGVGRMRRQAGTDGWFAQVWGCVLNHSLKVRL